MTDFDLDDPLADLLSDGSNDSFFEDPKATAKRPSLTKTPEKKSVSELFGIENLDVKVSDPKVNWLELDENSKKVSQKSLNQTSPKKLVKKISFEDDNILSTLAFEEKIESKQNINQNQDMLKKASLMESIMKPATLGEKNISFDDILKTSKIPKKSETDSQPFAKSIRKSHDSQSNQQIRSDVQREGRRPHQSQPGFTDYLGLFSSEASTVIETNLKKSVPLSPEKKIQSINIANDTKYIAGHDGSEIVQTEVLFSAPTNRDMKTKSAPNISALPDWLKGTSVEIHKSDTILPLREESEISMTHKPEAQISENSIPQKDIQMIDLNISQPDNHLLHSLITQQKLAMSDMDYQNTAIAVQQQNSQLIMALQLKKYEENLTAMQRNQKELLSKQEKQFNSLLERQLAKQQIIENNMRMQQERINNHIQVLLSQSSISDSGIQEDLTKLEDIKKNNANESILLFEELINSLKQKSQEEKFLLEESYKKQITMLEQTMESIENRLKTEIDYLHTSHVEKYEQLKNNYVGEIQKYKEKIEEMSLFHTNEIKSIRENHDRIIEEIKYEYSTLIENIKQIKQSENALFQNSSEYSQKLDTGIKLLDVNTKLLVDVREKVDNDYGILSIAREESLKTKEEEIKLMKVTLEKARSSAENERSQLLALVRNLEMKLTEQSQNGREERWAMQQAAATLTARSAALDRETEFNRTCIEREREQLKTLKETLLAEQENRILQLTEEKLALSAEKARLETSAKLSQNYDSQKTRAEIDAAIEVAKKAAELTDIERKNLHKLQCDVQILKRSLLDREFKLAAKEKELETMMQIAERKSKDGEQAIVLANATQRDYNERLKDIQNQLVSLTTREKKLTEEKISLSRERLTLQSQMRLLKHPTLYIKDTVEYDCPESV